MPVSACYATHLSQAPDQLGAPLIGPGILGVLLGVFRRLPDHFLELRRLRQMQRRVRNGQHLHCINEIRGIDGARLARLAQQSSPQLVGDAAIHRFSLQPLQLRRRRRNLGRGGVYLRLQVLEPRHGILVGQLGLDDLLAWQAALGRELQLRAQRIERRHALRGALAELPQRLLAALHRLDALRHVLSGGLRRRQRSCSDVLKRASGRLDLAHRAARIVERRAGRLVQHLCQQQAAIRQDMPQLGLHEQQTRERAQMLEG
jgi:hypothetical protein